MRKNLTIIGTSVVILLVLAVSIAFGQTDPHAADQARIKQLEQEIESNKAQYIELSTRKARSQEYCTAARAQAEQMTSLNGSNNAKRDEIRFLRSKLTDFQQPQQ